MRSLYGVRLKVGSLRIAVVFLVLFAACRATAQELINIGMAASNFSFLPFYVAEERGFYTKHNLKVNAVLMRSDVAISAVNSGNVDYVSHFNGLIRGALLGLDLKVLFATASKQMFSLVTQPEIRTVADLKGKTVGIASFGSAEHVTTVRTLKAVGLNPERDIVIRPLGQEHIRVQSLLARQIDAAMINPPPSVILKSKGFNLLVNAADYVDFPLTGLGTSGKKIREAPDQVRRLLLALYQSLQFIRNNRTESVDIFARKLRIDPQIAAGTYDVGSQALSTDGTASNEGILASIQLMSDTAKPVKSFSSSDVADFSLLRSVIKEHEKKN